MTHTNSILDPLEELFVLDTVMAISHSADHGIMVHEWFNYDPIAGDEDVFVALDAVYETFKQKQCSKVLVLVSTVKGAFSPDVLKFISDVQFPRLLGDTQLKYVATIVSKDHYEEVNSHLWIDQLLNEEKLVMGTFHTNDEAIEWLSQFKQ